MNNLHRGLAPVSEAAWASIEESARQIFALYLAGRRVTDVTGPAGAGLAAVTTGHVTSLEIPSENVFAGLRQVQPLVELRVPFSLGRQSVDDVERGAKDADWRPLQDAAATMALTEDHLIVSGHPGAGITGITAAALGTPLALPTDVRTYPQTVSQALARLRAAGVGGPFSLLLSPAIFTEVSGVSEYGSPVLSDLARLTGGDVLWTPAVSGGLLVSARGGDYELHLGEDLAIGYLDHDADRVRLYVQESLTFQVHTPEAAVALTAAG